MYAELVLVFSGASSFDQGHVTGDWCCRSSACMQLSRPQAQHSQECCPAAAAYLFQVLRIFTHSRGLRAGRWCLKLTAIRVQANTRTHVLHGVCAAVGSG